MDVLCDTHRSLCLIIVNALLTFVCFVLCVVGVLEGGKCLLIKSNSESDLKTNFSSP